MKRDVAMDALLDLNESVFGVCHKHRHASDKSAPCEFKGAQQLLEDFFADVDRVLLGGQQAMKTEKLTKAQGKIGVRSH